MRLFSSMRILRVLLALTVALWMAGAGCMLGCENNIAAAADHAISHPNPVTIVASGDACAASRSHDCCAKHKAATSAPKAGSEQEVDPGTNSTAANQPSAIKDLQIGATPSTMENCPLAVNATAALAKIKLERSPAVVTMTPPAALTANDAIQMIALSTPPRLPNRGHTYLHCCVFLI